MADLAPLLEESINRFDLIPRQRPLARHAILCSRHKVDLVPGAVWWKGFRDLVGKDVFKLFR